MIISRTPFRVSFFGGGTDYPVWYKEHGGAVLATSIDKYCYISLRHLPPFFEHKNRIVYSRIEAVDSVSRIEHPAVRECLRYMEVSDGLEIHHDGDLPARAGLGSSSSFTVGLLHALYALKQSMPTKMKLAEDAIRVERDLIKESVGSQDQVTAALGGFNKIRFQSDGTIAVEPVIVRHDRLESLQDHLMLFFTGFSRHASEIAKAQVRNTPKKKTELKAILAMVEEGLSLLGGKSDLMDFGKLLHEGWALKRSLSDQISTPAVDEVYAAARKAGAVGGKLLGAGGGGFILLFARPQDRPRIHKALAKLLHVPFRFENSGSSIIFYDQNSREQEFSMLEGGPARSKATR